MKPIYFTTLLAASGLWIGMTLIGGAPDFTALFWIYPTMLMNTMEKAVFRIINSCKGRDKAIAANDIARFTDISARKLFRLAGELQWRYKGEEDCGDEYLRWRLERFAASKTGSRDQKSVRIIESLTSKEASNLIRALGAMLKEQASSSTS